MEVSLKNIKYPQDLKKINIGDLSIIADELREKIIYTASKVGGHLGGNLGVIELTIALHYVFNTPIDRIIWDIGHQTYGHKILTGRGNEIETIRQYNGLSGFTKKTESIYDVFGAGHSSTALSAGLGIATGKLLSNSTYEVISIIGDGALSAGMAYEALNNVASLKTKMIIILNDNGMSISRSVGGMANHLTNLNPKYNIFTDLGIEYRGIFDGHDLENLIKIFNNIKDEDINYPILLHLKTEKAYKAPNSIIDDERIHAISKFNYNKPIKSSKKINTYSNISVNTLNRIAETDNKIVAITAAMVSGTGLSDFKFKDRLYDVGIAEQHVVTFAAGLTISGYKPYCFIYSTFLQRAYDQVIHDVVIQNLAVRFLIDRAGIVGADGMTHAGIFDLGFLGIIPNIYIMVPSDEDELSHMIYTSSFINDRPCAIRYPKKNISSVINNTNQLKRINLGKGYIKISYGLDIAILNLGTKIDHVLVAAYELLQENIKITVADARFAKPIDKELITDIVNNHKAIIIIEEGVAFFALQVIQYIKEELNIDILIKTIAVPNEVIPHGNIEEIYSLYNMDKNGIINIIKEVYNKISQHV